MYSQECIISTIGNGMIVMHHIPHGHLDYPRHQGWQVLTLLTYQSRCRIDFLADIVHIVSHEFLSQAHVLARKAVHPKVPHLDVNDWYD